MPYLEAGFYFIQCLPFAVYIFFFLLFCGLVFNSKKVGASIKKSITWVETALRTQVQVV